MGTNTFQLTLYIRSIEISSGDKAEQRSKNEDVPGPISFKRCQTSTSNFSTTRLSVEALFGGLYIIIVKVSKFSFQKLVYGPF